MIKIIKHRCNDLPETKYAAEVDVWNCEGYLNLNHDVPLVGSDDHDYPNLTDALDKYSYVAINAKSSGLEIMKPFLRGKNNYFIFDCAVPEAIKLCKLGLRVFTRESEYEASASFYDYSCGVWLDMFETNWVCEDVINEHLGNKKEVAIVSPELHGRAHKGFWQKLRKIAKESSFGIDIFLCTKYPEEADEFFNGSSNV